MPDPSHLRLLPWTTPEGKPCLLHSDGNSRLSRLADAIEADQLDWADTLLARSADVLRNGEGTETELRFLVARLREALVDTTRIAESRGSRLPPPPYDAEDDPEP